MISPLPGEHTLKPSSANQPFFGVEPQICVTMAHNVVWMKGQGLYAFVTLKEGLQSSSQLENDLRQSVRALIGPIAIPDRIHFAPALPKTRSGKIMRRILRKIAADDLENLGDISTLADPRSSKTSSVKNNPSILVWFVTAQIQ